jgi:ribosomal protein S18 acetylase RimI-like enzyme
MIDPEIYYAVEPSLHVSEFKELLISSGLAASRPVADEERLSKMLSNSSLLLTARANELGNPLVGIARGISDGSWCCYLSELAVSSSMQGRGIGKNLLMEAKRHLGPDVSLILISMPEATKFYEHVGMARIADAFWFKRER